MTGRRMEFLAVAQSGIVMRNHIIIYHINLFEASSPERGIRGDT